MRFPRPCDRPQQAGSALTATPLASLPLPEESAVLVVIHSSEVNMEKLEVLAMKSEVTRAGAEDGKCFAIS